MRCAANANDAPIALKPGLIFFFFCFFTFWLSLWIYGLYGFVLVFDSASKSKSTSFHIAPVAFFVLSVRLCSLIKPLRCDPIPADIYPFTQIYLYISLARWGQWTGKARRVALHWKLDTKCQVPNKFFHSKWKWKPSLESRWSGYRFAKCYWIEILGS